ncbi:MAG: GNAT family N-acetyltransferase [Caldisericota bacterium]|nr:GNAT family N-acetyltransferase [Caldisericota bacterium]
MHVRQADLGDIPAFVAMGREMHGESIFREYDFDEPKLYEYFRNLIESDWGIVHTLVKDGEVIGGFAGLIWPHFFGNDKQSADIALFITEQHRGSRAAVSLLKAYVEDAKAKGASQILIANSTGFEQERVVQLFESVGFQKVGAVLSMHVPRGDK